MMLHDDIAKVLNRVSCLEGVVSTRSDDEIAIMGGHFDDYLLVGYFAQLLERGEMRITIDPPERWDYVAKLVKGK